MQTRRIAVTMGDPAGIGPELSLKLLATRAVSQRCTPVVFGDAEILKRVGDKLGLAVPRRIISKDEWASAAFDVTEPAILDLAAIAAADVQAGAVDSATGRASYEYIEKSIDAALAGQVDAVVTGPIHKVAIHAAGVPYPGHTEIFAAKTGAERVCMMLTSNEITCSFVTAHVGLRDVPGLLSVKRVLDTIELSHGAMVRLRGRAPKLVVCGLNPHAGENGLFGDRDEERIIVPAIQAACAGGIDVQGPVPADTAFLPQQRSETDCYVCMYHDQGLIPLKALAFDEAVNVTLGLPIIRTSVDHGTALDIAWQGKASVNSLIQAVELAVRLAESKRWLNA